MQNRPVWFVWVGERGHSARRRRHFADGYSRRTHESSRKRLPSRDRRKSYELSGRMPDRAGNMPALPIALFACILAWKCFAQDATPTPSPSEAEVESVVVSATRFDIPLDQSPSSVSVITSEDIEQKQIQRVSDALREVPGLTVVQTGTAGQL